MIKVSVEVRSGTASFRVGVQAQSIRRALSIVGKRYPGSLVKVSFPIDPEGFFIEGAGAGRAGLVESPERVAA
jgi:hypothetical protein